jgi:hypothetical protein
MCPGFSCVRPGVCNAGFLIGCSVSRASHLRLFTASSSIFRSPHLSACSDSHGWKCNWIRAPTNTILTTYDSLTPVARFMVCGNQTTTLTRGSSFHHSQRAQHLYVTTYGHTSCHLVELEPSLLFLSDCSPTTNDISSDLARTTVVYAEDSWSTAIRAIFPQSPTTVRESVRHRCMKLGPATTLSACNVANGAPSQTWLIMQRKRSHAIASRSIQAGERTATAQLFSESHSFVSLQVCCGLHCRRRATAGLACLYIASTSAAKMLSASARAERELVTCETWSADWNTGAQPTR